MTVTSNIKAVMGRVQGLRDAIPGIIEEVLQPSEWIEEAIEVATQTLTALATGDEWLHIPDFVLSVKAALLSGERGFALTMEPYPYRGLSGGGNTLGFLQQTGDGMELFVQNAQDLILQWVQTPEDEGGKRRDSRDASKSDEEIANFISYIMLTTQPNPTVAGARARLMPHILDFINAKSGNSALPPETVDVWLKAVLAAWRKMVSAQLTKRFRAALKAKKFP